MNKIISVISVFMALAIGVVSCSDEENVYSNEMGSQLNDAHSIFYLQKKYMDLEPGMNKIVVNLTPERGDREISVVASVLQIVDYHVVHMPIADIGNIPNGVYTMLCKTLDGKIHSSRLNVDFKDNMLHHVNYVLATYLFPADAGKGTKGEPYKIKSAEYFDMFKAGLKADSTKGKGLYFQQDSSFAVLFDASGSNRGFGCEDFAGNYDGNGKTIVYEYYGSGHDSIDSNQGLFATLRDGANVSNLKIRASLKNISYNGGALAGVVNGNVTIKDVHYHVNISSQSGYDNSRNVGGLIGNVENAILTVNECGTLDNTIEVSGRSCVGGLIGSVSNSSLKIEKAEIVHEISSANADVTPIYSSSDCAGGLIGRIESTNSTCSLNDCKVSTAIKATDKFSGGLIGSVTSNYEFTITNCSVASFVKGGKYVGGFIGNFSGNGELKLSGENKISNRQISGEGTIGGVIGKLNNTKFDLSGTTNVKLGEYAVVATLNVAGGFIGEIDGTNVDIQQGEVSFGNAMNVKGNMCVGGFVGLMSNSTLSSSSNVSFSSSIPKKSSYSFMFKGNVEGNSRVGGAVGHSVNSSITGFAISANVTGKDSIGGVVGSAELSTTNCFIEDCSFDGKIEATGKDIGGICGKFTKDGKINYCINYGLVIGDENVGGVAGAANYGEITQRRTFFNRCVNVGDVTGNKEVAGIVGYLHGDDDFYIQVTSCANYGSIQGGSGTTGGIVGGIPSTKGRIYYCVNHGSVKSTKACRTGGIIGKMGNDPTGAYQSTNLEIGWCANTGDVSCDGDSEVGGIVGWAEEGAVGWNDQDSFVHDCYNTGTISESGGEAGGIIGYSDRYCYLKCLANYGETDYAIVGDYKYGPDLYDDYTYYTKGSPTKNIADTFLSDPSNPDSYDGFDFSGTWQIYDGRAILQKDKCPFQLVEYNP